eukprot:1850409-Pyramimonas_sp.AAC.1
MCREGAAREWNCFVSPAGARQCEATRPCERPARGLCKRSPPRAFKYLAGMGNAILSVLTIQQHGGPRQPGRGPGLPRGDSGSSRAPPQTPLLRRGS